MPPARGTIICRVSKCFVKLPANNYCARRVLSSGIPPAANPSAASASLNKEVEECYNRLDLSFTNAKEAFKSKTNRDLFRGLLVFRLCTIDFLVQHNQRLLQIMRKMLGRTLFTALLKSTFYGHFVAGETHEEVEKTSAKLARFGVKAILDYSVESDISQGEAEDKAVEGIVGQENLPEAITSNMDKKALDQTHQQYTVHKEFEDFEMADKSAFVPVDYEDDGLKKTSDLDLNIDGDFFGDSNSPAKSPVFPDDASANKSASVPPPSPMSNKPVIISKKDGAK